MSPSNLKSQIVISNESGTGPSATFSEVVAKCNHLSGVYELEITICDFKRGWH